MSEKAQVLWIIAVVLVWLFLIIIPWPILGPATFWQRFFLLVVDLVWAGVTGFCGLWIIANILDS